MINNKQYIALNRFGYGYNENLGNAYKSDPKGWLSSQLLFKPKLISAQQNSATELIDYMHGVSMGRKSRPAMEIKTKQRQLRAKLKDDVGDIVLAAAKTENPFLERLVSFWRNHFTVVARKEVLAICGSYEKEAIRPNILGYFSDMLLAVEQHPAMIFYLDNRLSAGSNSIFGRRQKRGLNENLAREILELHTMGVNSGYKQEDVTSLAKIITGWTVNYRPWKKEATGKFIFFEKMHEPGEHILLGKNFADNGLEQGEQALKYIAQRAETAKFICTKLAKHFISDKPKAASIAKLQKAFMDSNGYLPAVYKELIELDEVWQQTLSKNKSSFDYMTSIFALAKVTTKDRKYIFNSLSYFDRLPFFAKSPAGYSDDSSVLNADELLRRVQYARQVATLKKFIDVPQAIYSQSIGSVDNVGLAQEIKGLSTRDATALILASPTFMRR